MIGRDKIFDGLVAIFFVNIFASTVYAKSDEPLLEVNSLLAISLFVIGGLAVLLWFICREKPAKMATRFGGVLKVEMVSLDDGSLRHTYPLYREAGSQLSLASILSVCKILSFRGIDNQIWLHVKDKHRIEFYYDADCTVLKDNDILLKHKRHFIYVGNSVVVLSKDGMHKLLLTYEVI